MAFNSLAFFFLIFNSFDILQKTGGKKYANEMDEVLFLQYVNISNSLFLKNTYLQINATRNFKFYK